MLIKLFFVLKLICISFLFSLMSVRIQCYADVHIADVHRQIILLQLRWRLGGGGAKYFLLPRGGVTENN